MGEIETMFIWTSGKPTHQLTATARGQGKKKMFASSSLLQPDVKASQWQSPTILGPCYQKNTRNIVPQLPPAALGRIYKGCKGASASRQV